MPPRTLQAHEEVFCAGAAAVTAVTFIHPIDVVKTRFQISTTPGATIGTTISSIYRSEGVGSFWKGIRAAWLREASYTSLRLGLYAPCKRFYGCDDPEKNSFLRKFAAGSTSGAIGSITGSPFDLLKTQMMANQSHTVQLKELMKTIYRDQGIAGFYRGFDSNIARAMVINGTKMACYDQIKETLVLTEMIPAGIATQFCAAFCAGFFMTVTAAPFDYVRTQMMNQSGSTREYKNALDCATKTVKKYGMGRLWKGFIPIWSRFAPTATLQLLFYEQIRGVVATTNTITTGV
jgi:hypothetical protein